MNRQAAGLSLCFVLVLGSCGRDGATRGGGPPAQASPAAGTAGTRPPPRAAGSFAARVVALDLEGGRITLREEPGGSERSVRVAEAALESLASLKAGVAVAVRCDEVGTVPIPPKGDRPEGPGAAGTTGPAGATMGTGAVGPGAMGLAGCGTVTTVSGIERR